MPVVCMSVVLFSAATVLMVRAPAVNADGTRAVAPPSYLDKVQRSTKASSQRIAFVWGRKRSHIWSIRSDGRGLRQLTAGTRNEHAPAWSPDRTKIAFVRGTAGRVGATSLWFMRADGKRERRIRYAGPSITDAAGDLAWSPDGRYLVGASLAGSYRCAPTVLDLRTRKSWVIHVAPQGYWLLGSVDWSPDSRRIIACLRTADPGPTVVIDPFGSAGPVEFDFGGDAWAYAVSWRPDGKWLQFFLWGLRNPQNWNELRTSDGVLLGDAPVAMHFSYAPFSSRYGYVTQVRGRVLLRRANADGSARRTVLNIGKWSTTNWIEDVAWK
jgi:Tol biopolymer transport system component